jgi:hypothetical protein
VSVGDLAKASDFNGKLTGTDSGWVTTGYTAQNSCTITTFQVRSIGSVAYLLVAGTLGFNVSSISSGDYPNTTILTMPSAYIPTVGWGLHSQGSSGPAFIYLLTSGGNLELTSGPGGVAFSSGQAFSIAGSYPLT